MTMQPITMLPLARPRVGGSGADGATQPRLPLVLVGGSDPQGVIRGASKYAARKLESVAVVQELDAWGFGSARQPANWGRGGGRRRCLF